MRDRVELDVLGVGRARGLRKSKVRGASESERDVSPQSLIRTLQALGYEGSAPFLPLPPSLIAKPGIDRYLSYATMDTLPTVVSFAGANGV